MRRVPVHAGGGQQQAAEVRGGGQVHAVRLPEDRLSGDPPLPPVSAKASINVLTFRYVPRSRGGFHVILIINSICLFKFL